LELRAGTRLAIARTDGYNRPVKEVKRAAYDLPGDRELAKWAIALSSTIRAVRSRVGP
jgi:hypothetical protein